MGLALGLLLAHSLHGLCLGLAQLRHAGLGIESKPFKNKGMNKPAYITGEVSVKTPIAAPSHWQIMSRTRSYLCQCLGSGIIQYFPLIPLIFDFMPKLVAAEKCN